MTEELCPNQGEPPPAVGEVADEEIDQCLIDAGVDAMEGESDGTCRTYYEGWRDQVIAGIRRAIALDRSRQQPQPAPPPTAAEVDGPAVPEIRGLASVWYTYCPEEGVDLYSSEEQARSAAESIMGSYEVAACSDGWHEDMESVSWGTLNPIETAQVVERRKAEPGSEFDEWIQYELRPATPPPAAGEVPGLSDAELESIARAAEIQNMKEQGGMTASTANGVQVQLQLQRLAGLRAVEAATITRAAELLRSCVLAPANALPLPSAETPESKGSESSLSEFGPNDMPLG